MANYTLRLGNERGCAPNQVGIYDTMVFIQFVMFHNKYSSVHDYIKFGSELMMRKFPVI